MRVKEEAIQRNYINTQ